MPRKAASLEVKMAFEEAKIRTAIANIQQGLDTTTPAGKAMFQMMRRVFAEFARAMIQEGSARGLRGPGARGKRLGRPPVRLWRLLGGLAYGSSPKRFGVNAST